MSKNTQKSRILVNTGALVAMSVAFGITTFFGVANMNTASINFQSISNAPSICFESSQTDSDGFQTLNNAYVCSVTTDGNTTASTEDQTLFIYDRLTLSSVLNLENLIIAFSSIGYMLAAASLVGAIVYYNHNRGK